MDKHFSKGLSQVPAQEYSAVITMGCGDKCSGLHAQLNEDWPLPDPKYGYGGVLRRA